MVASVSYDRTKKQFNYDNFKENAFEGAEEVEEMKRRQETTLARARERFDEATEGESTSKTRASFVSEPVRDLHIDG